MLQVIKDSFDLLTFRITREAMLNFGWQHFIYGLIWTWLVGMGRYWDNPRAEILQHLGLGSIAYIFFLSFLLFIFLLPLRVKNLSYFRILTFVSLVSPPAILYAIPVEKFFSFSAANELNAWFLFFVASWRIALLIFVLQRLFEMKGIAIFSATLLPITLIVFCLVALNLEKAVFLAMIGGSVNDDAYFVLYLISVFSFLFLPITIICYIASLFKVWKVGDKYKKFLSDE